MMNMPGFTAEESLIDRRGGKKFCTLLGGVASLHLAAIATHCGPCQRDADYPDVCMKTCCRVGRIDDGDQGCFTRSCSCPPCGACERDPNSPTGASITCCYETATAFHPAGCVSRLCRGPNPEPEHGPECRGVFCRPSEVCTYDGCCRPSDAFGEFGYGGEQCAAPDGLDCHCRNPRKIPGQCPPRLPISCGDGTCCPTDLPTCISFGGQSFCTIFV